MITLRTKMVGEQFRVRLAEMDNHDHTWTVDVEVLPHPKGFLVDLYFEAGPVGYASALHTFHNIEKHIFLALARS